MWWSTISPTGPPARYPGPFYNQFLFGDFFPCGGFGKSGVSSQGMWAKSLRWGEITPYKNGLQKLSYFSWGPFHSPLIFREVVIAPSETPMILRPIYRGPSYVPPCFLSIDLTSEGFMGRFCATYQDPPGMVDRGTLPETHNSHLKMGFPKRKRIFQPSIFRC